MNHGVKLSPVFGPMVAVGLIDLGAGGGVQKSTGFLAAHEPCLVAANNATEQIPTLVYCGAGMSRSPAIVAAALSIVQGGSPDERLKGIVAGHPHDVSPHLWEVVGGACSRMGKGD